MKTFVYVATTCASMSLIVSLIRGDYLVSLFFLLLGCTQIPAIVKIVNSAVPNQHGRSERRQVASE